MNAPVSPVINKTVVTTAHATARLTPSAPEPTAKRLPTPAELRQRISLSDPLTEQIARQRHAVQQILSGHDDRLLVVVGPCSVHDPDAALEYADRLAALSEEISERILPVMRVYVENRVLPWAGKGWPTTLADGSGDMPRGLALSRELMHAVAARVRRWLPSFYNRCWRPT